MPGLFLLIVTVVCWNFITGVDGPPASASLAVDADGKDGGIHATVDEYLGTAAAVDVGRRRAVVDNVAVGPCRQACVQQEED